MYVSVLSGVCIAFVDSSFAKALGSSLSFFKHGGPPPNNTITAHTVRFLQGQPHHSQFNVLCKVPKVFGTLTKRNQRLRFFRLHSSKKVDCSSVLFLAVVTAGVWILQVCGHCRWLNEVCCVKIML